MHVYLTYRYTHTEKNLRKTPCLPFSVQTTNISQHIFWFSQKELHLKRTPTTLTSLEPGTKESEGNILLAVRTQRQELPKKLSKEIMRKAKGRGLCRLCMTLHPFCEGRIRQHRTKHKHSCTAAASASTNRHKSSSGSFHLPAWRMGWDTLHSCLKK